jgi:hypothetical protein
VLLAGGANVHALDNDMWTPLQVSSSCPASRVNQLFSVNNLCASMLLGSTVPFFVSYTARCQIHALVM